MAAHRRERFRDASAVLSRSMPRASARRVRTGIEPYFFMLVLAGPGCRAGRLLRAGLQSDVRIGVLTAAWGWIGSWMPTRCSAVPGRHVAGRCRRVAAVGRSRLRTRYGAVDRLLLRLMLNVVLAVLADHRARRLPPGAVVHAANDRTCCSTPEPRRSAGHRYGQ